MINMRYYMPTPDLTDFLASYYIVDFDTERMDDIIQAEQAQIRFGITGRYDMAVDGRGGVYRGGVLFGPRTRPVSLGLEGPARAFGVGLLPLGVSAILGIEAHEIHNLILPLDAVVGVSSDHALWDMQAATSDAELVDIANRFFRLHIRRHDDLARRFQHCVESWLVNNPDPQIDRLVELNDVSWRQVERLTKRYFGVTPKMLARKSRVLRAAAQLRLEPQLGWQDVAGTAFYDQSHFIREFRHFVGLTPGEFARFKAPVMGPSLRARNEQRLLSPLAMLT